MASGEPRSAELIQHAREGNTDQEPLLTRQRTIVERERSLYANLTDEGRQIVGFTAGENIDVHVFSDGVVILPQKDTDER